MKVISLWQPWATLCVLGAKQVETRFYNTKLRGLLLIHATKTLQTEHAETCLTNLHFKKYIPDPYKLPLSAIVGCVTVKEVYPTKDLADRGLVDLRGTTALATEEFYFGDYSAGRYGWHLVDAIKFEQPVPCSGTQGLWNLPESLVATVTELISKHKK